MCKSNFVLAFTLLISCSLYSQEQMVHAAPEGFLVFLGRAFAKDFTYVVSRKEAGENEFQRLAEIGGPVTRQEFDDSWREQLPSFGYLAALSPIDADRYWQHYEDSKLVDSLFLMDVTLGYLGLGLAYLDTTAVVGKRYQYQVAQMNLSETIGVRQSQVRRFEAPSLEHSTAFISSDYDGQHVQLKWSAPSQLGWQRYLVFRRDNLQGGFTRLAAHTRYGTSNDSTVVWVTDTLADPHQVYEYFLRPVDIFGNAGTPSELCQQASFSDADFPYLRRFDATGGRDRRMVVTWNFEQKPFIRSVQLLRSMNYDSGYVEIAELMPSDTMYVDHVAVAMENYYYRLVLRGPHGISQRSVATMGHYEETGYPAAPEEVTATPIPGGVKIEWNDPERLTAGFYVHRRLSRERSFRQITEIIPLDYSRHYVYLDTSSQLVGNEYYDYVVQAINDGFRVSAFSDTASARPDIPTTIDVPTGFRARKDKESCYLFWDDQGKVNEDLRGYRLLRNAPGQEDPETLVELIPSTRNHYHDTTIEIGHTYRYQLQAIDYFGAESAVTLPIELTWHTALPAPPPAPKVAQAEEGVRVQWHEIRQEGLDAYRVYRYRPGTTPVLLDELTSDQLRYVDRSVQPNVLYFYYLTSVNVYDLESAPGKSVSIRWQ